MTKQQLFIEKCAQLQAKLKTNLLKADNFDKVEIQTEINTIEYFKYNRFQKMASLPGVSVIYN
jgi:hypothetical protein